MKRFAALLALIGLVAAAIACGAQPSPATSEGKLVPQKSLDQVLQENTERLLALPGVVGTAEGQCAGQPCIQVFVAKKTPGLVKRIPHAIQGYPVVVVETGEFRARDSR